jgi:hypothetical protein
VPFSVLAFDPRLADAKPALTAPRLNRADVLRSKLPSSSGPACASRAQFATLRQESLSSICAGQAENLRPRHGLRPIANVQLGEDMFHVRLDRFWSDREISRNLLVGQPLTNQLEYVAFARTQ